MLFLATNAIRNFKRVKRPRQSMSQVVTDGIKFHLKKLPLKLLVKTIEAIIVVIWASRVTLMCYIDILIFTHLKLCLATAIHNFKWVKITHICLIRDQTFTNFDVLTLVSFPIAAI